jgi:hypothetical protein
MVNLLGIQIFAVIFALVMLYFTYFYYRRKDLNINDLLVWSIVWIVFLFGVLFPQNLDFFMYQVFNVISVIQLFTIFGFIFFSIIIFYLYKTVRKNQRKIEKLVKNIAIKEAKENATKNNEH